MNKCISILLFYIVSGSFITSSFAQDADKKILISNMDEVYTYERNKKGEVEVKAEHTITYKAVKASKVNFVEFYDNYSEINNLKIKGVSGVSPQYGMYNRDGVFFSDAKACYCEIPLTKINSEVTVRYTKIYKDIRRFHFLPLSEAYYTNSRIIKFVVPDWLDLEVLSQNLTDNIVVKTEKDETKKVTTITASVTNQPEYVSEDDSPDYAYSQPYMTIVPKESIGENGNVKYFKSVDDLYQWSKEPLSLMDNDLSEIKQKADALTKNSNSNEAKINDLCRWVQQNIRYIAFADGISAFKPDNAQDVISKKYGDCKGMSNLLKLLLVSEGFDARLVWIATADTERDLDVKKPIPYANHMICALYKNDSLYYFDPTVKSLILGEIPEQLQGQTVLIENGDKYIVSQIPKYDASYNRDSLYINYSIVDSKLVGKATRTFKGESKHAISYWMSNMTESERKSKAEDFLTNRQIGDSILNIQTKGLDIMTPEISLSYDSKRKSDINLFDGKFYISLDERKEFQNTKIDIEKRKTAIKHQGKTYLVRTSELLIPDGYDVGRLPENISVDREKYSFKTLYSKERGKVVYHKEILVFNPILEKEDFEQWNSDIDTLKKAYGDLVVLEKK